MTSEPSIARPNSAKALAQLLVALLIVLQVLLLAAPAHALRNDSVPLGVDAQGWHIYMTQNFKQRHIVDPLNSLKSTQAYKNRIPSAYVNTTLTKANLVTAVLNNDYKCTDPAPIPNADVAFECVYTTPTIVTTPKNQTPGRAVRVTGTASFDGRGKPDTAEIEHVAKL